MYLYTGMVFDSSGSYSITFILSGALIVVSGVMLLAMPWISRREERRRLQRVSKLRTFNRPTVAVKPRVSRQSRPRTRTSFESYTIETSSILRLGETRPSISNNCNVTSSRSEPQIRWAWWRQCDRVTWNQWTQLNSFCMFPRVDVSRSFDHSSFSHPEWVHGGGPALPWRPLLDTGRLLANLIRCSKSNGSRVPWIYGVAVRLEE